MNNSGSCTHVWLDKNVNSSDESIAIREKLIQAINDLRVFDDPEKCVTYLINSNGEKIILIVSASFGYKVMPVIHEMEQLIGIYVYCFDKKTAEEWTKSFSKVSFKRLFDKLTISPLFTFYKIKGVFRQSEELIRAVSTDDSVHEQTNIDALVVNIYSAQSGHASQEKEFKNSIFVYFQLLTSILLEMTTDENSTAKEDLVAYVKRVYEGSAAKERAIEKFENDYRSKEAIFWYTKETFFYQILNQALRESDYEVLFALRLFVKDLSLQLGVEHTKFLQTFTSSDSILRVYRGQTMSVNDLTFIRQNIGQFFCAQEFLSTSTNPEVAIKFAKRKTPTAELIRILLQFNIDTRKSDTQPYAKIEHLSAHREENEVLIMLGSIFKIEQVDFNEQEQMWIGILSLCSHREHQFSDLMTQMKEKSRANVSSFDQLLHQETSENTIDYYTQRLLNPSLSALDRANYHGKLGDIYLNYKAYHDALVNYIQQLDILIGLSDQVNIALTHKSIAEVYYQKRENASALEHAQKALNTLLRFKQPSLSEAYQAISNIYLREHELYEQLSQHYSKVREYSLEKSPDHRLIASVYKTTAHIWHGRGKYKKALQYYAQAKGHYQLVYQPGNQVIENLEKDVELAKAEVKLVGEECEM